MTINIPLPTIHVVRYGVNIDDNLKAEIAKAHRELIEYETSSTSSNFHSYESITSTKIESTEDVDKEQASNPKRMRDFLNLYSFEHDIYREERDRIEAKITRHLEKLQVTPSRIIPLQGAVILPRQYKQTDTFENDLDLHQYDETKEALYYHFAFHANDALKAGKITPYRLFESKANNQEYDIQIDRLSTIFQGETYKLGYLLEGNQRDFVNMSNFDIEDSPIFDIAQIVNDSAVNPAKIYENQRGSEMGWAVNQP